MTRVGLSIDVDSVASHLRGYGFTAPRDDGAAYRAAIPRVLGMLERVGARATFFLVGDEARRHPDVVDRIAVAGHEIASHSMTHRLPFSGLSIEEARLETSGSRILLRELSGQNIVGFRAPSWDLGMDGQRAVQSAGYRYDASAFPSIILPFLRRAVARRGVENGTKLRMTWNGAFGRADIRLQSEFDNELASVPMCTTPILRLPYYHTVRFVLPAPLFGIVRALAACRRDAIWYQFHAVDFLGVEEDGLDARIRRHPGMKLRLDEKLALAESEVRRLGRRGDVRPLREIVEEMFTRRVDPGGDAA